MYSLLLDLFAQHQARVQAREHHNTISQKPYIETILQHFSLEDAKPLKILMDPNTHLSKEDCPSTKEEEAAMKKVLYVMIFCYMCLMHLFHFQTIINMLLLLIISRRDVFLLLFISILTCFHHHLFIHAFAWTVTYVYIALYMRTISI